jgi:hypothetical protein
LADRLKALADLAECRLNRAERNSFPGMKIIVVKRSISSHSYNYSFD